jgi:hypothetical protein
MKTWQWVTIIIVAVAALLVGAVLGPLFVGGGGPGYWSRGGMTLAPHASAGVGGYSGGGMMGGFGFAPFGWIGMLLMWVFPLGVLVLVVLGIVWLVNAVSRPRGQAPVAPAKTCPNCARPVQADWRNCPHCGTALGG